MYEFSNEFFRLEDSEKSLEIHNHLENFAPESLPYYLPSYEFTYTLDPSSIFPCIKRFPFDWCNDIPQIATKLTPKSSSEKSTTQKKSVSALLQSNKKLYKKIETTLEFIKNYDINATAIKNNVEEIPKKITGPFIIDKIKNNNNSINFEATKANILRELKVWSNIKKCNKQIIEDRKSVV